MKKLSLVFFMLCLAFCVGLAQSTITGTVTDETGEPLIGATVKVKDIALGTVTDIDGSYSVDVPAGTTVLEVSYTGFSTIDVNIDGRATIDVVLLTDVAVLDEIVVTGVATGTSTHKLGFSVGKVNEETLKQTPGTNAATALQGKVAGVNIVSGSGRPGTSPAIRLRASTNISTNLSQAPLIIVDGVQLAGAGALADINSEDIITMEVIKGAAASSFYGSRAANGVINIITKRGSDQAGVTDIVFRNEFGRSALTKSLDLNEHHAYELGPDGAPDFTKQSDDAYADNDYPRIFDHQDLFFDPGTFMTNSISVANRTAQTNFYFSLNNSQQEGIIDFSQGYARQSIRANIDHKISKKVKLKLSNYYMQSNDKPVPEAGSAGNPFYSLLFIEPHIDLTAPNEEDGSPYDWDAPALGNSAERNPLYRIANEDRTQDVNRFTGNYALSFQPIDFLTLSVDYSMDRRSTTFESFFEKGYLSDDVSGRDRGYISRQLDTRTYQTTSAKVTFQKKFGQVGVTAQTFYLYEDDNLTRTFASARDFRFKGLKSLSNAADFISENPDDPPQNRTNATSFDTDVRSENVYFTTQLDIADKLIVDGLIRADGSSLFGENNRWNTFYRGSVAYRISEDINIRGVDELKVRASYGTAGNRPGYIYRFETYTSGGRKLNLGNKDLRSSLSSELELGIDGYAFGLMSFSFNYAISQSEENFYNIVLPAAAGGASNQWINIPSSLDGKSFEATLGFDLIQKEKMGLSLNFVFDRVRQTLTKFDYPDQRVGPGSAFLQAAGEPFGIMYGEKFARSVNDLSAAQREGVNYVVNNDGYLVVSEDRGTPGEIPIKVEDETGNTLFVIGDINPDFNLGMNVNFNIGGFNAYALLHWKQGGDIYNNTRQWILRELRGGEVDQAGKAQEDKLPIGYYSTLYNVNAVTEHFVEDGTFLKLRELAIGYTFGKNNLGAMSSFLKGVKVALVGRNLFTASNYTGYDPEVSTAGDATNYMFDGYGYPNFRTISGSIELKF